MHVPELPHRISDHQGIYNPQKNGQTQQLQDTSYSHQTKDYSISLRLPQPVHIVDNKTQPVPRNILVDNQQP